MNNILIIGSGQIGKAAFRILKSLCRPVKAAAPKTLNDTLSQIYKEDNIFTDCTVQCWDKVQSDNVSQVVDVAAESTHDLTGLLVKHNITHVLNALPFFLNEKIATAAVAAGCDYIDFTEDDEMAEKVKSIYSASNLNCAVKCGLAPGFINYVGHNLSKRIDFPERLMISVGALPRTVSFKNDDPGSNYNLTWSVDGLVNEYIRPCTVRINGAEKKIPALTGVEKVIIDGKEYEAAFTSGGIGSLVSELKHIPNVSYKTLRYPGHYSYVKEAVDRHRSDFNAIKREFISKFPYTRDDVIIVHAECTGKMKNGTLLRETFSTSFTGMHELTAIQSTTAGGALSVLELILKGQLKGIISHKDVPLGAFLNTEIYQRTYFKNMRG